MWGQVIDFIVYFPGPPKPMFYHNIVVHFPIVLVLVLPALHFFKTPSKKLIFFAYGLFAVSLGLTFYLGQRIPVLAQFQLEQSAWISSNQDLFRGITQHKLLAISSLILTMTSFLSRILSVNKKMLIFLDGLLVCSIWVTAHLGANLRIEFF